MVCMVHGVWWCMVYGSVRVTSDDPECFKDQATGAQILRNPHVRAYRFTHSDKIMNVDQYSV